MELQLFIPFDEIIPGCKVHYFVDENQEIFISSVEVVHAVTGKDRKHASTLLANLREDIFPPNKFIFRAVRGMGNHHARFLNIQDTIQLIMVLPGKIAKQFRRVCATIITRYLGGDPSLITEIEANSISTHAINVMARGEVACGLKRTRDELEIEHMRADLAIKQADARARTIQNHVALIGSFRELCNGGEMDGRDRVIFKSLLLNIATSGTSISSDSGSPDEFLTISSVATDKGYKINSSILQKVGVMAARLYRERYGKAPEKHKQFVDGAVREVNTYTKDDEDILLRALGAFYIDAQRQIDLLFPIFHLLARNKLG